MDSHITWPYQIDLADHLQDDMGVYNKIYRKSPHKSDLTLIIKICTEYPSHIHSLDIDKYNARYDY